MWSVQAAEWQALWKEHSPETAVPAVDFAQSSVVGVFLGFRPTAGFSVEITAVRVEGARTVVEYVEHRPPRDAFVAQILTFPFHIVRTCARRDLSSSDAWVRRRPGWIGVGDQATMITAPVRGSVMSSDRIPNA